MPLELSRSAWPKKEFPAGSMIILLAVLILFSPGGYSTGLAATAGTVDAIYNFGASDFLVDPDRPYVYATSSNSLKIINSSNLAVEASIPLPAVAYGMAMSQDGSKMYLAS